LCAVACGQSAAPTPAQDTSNPGQQPGQEPGQQPAQPPINDNPVEASEAVALAAPAAVSAKGLRDRVSRLHLGDDKVTVVVELADQPVAVARANAIDKQISAEETRAISESLQSQQDSLAPTIEALGGEVMATYHYVLNGLKVRIAASKVGALTMLPGVVAVKNLAVYQIENAQSVPLIGAPAVWQGCAPFGNCGEGIKIAIVDTGIDYTHANFGAKGDPADFVAASATSTAAADPKFFGPTAPRVKGGTDLVGDAYDANDPKSTPQPDPNPLDCNGHGSHTAGTAAGSGVTVATSTSPAKTFTGPYDTAHDDGTTTAANFKIGPGVAPKADIYAVRVFGCNGSSNLVTDALEWSMKNGMQVVSMSLGGNYGSSQSADAEASTNAANAGIIVVAASGNAGNITYITSSPASGDKA